MPETPGTSSGLCGVRLERSGPVLFVASNGHDVAPGQLVVVEQQGREELAIVVFGPAQLVADEPGAGAVGKLLRLATDEEAARFEGLMAPENGVSAAGLPSAWVEWLVAPGEAPGVQVAMDEDVPSAQEFIDRLFPGEEPRGSYRA